MASSSRVIDYAAFPQPPSSLFRDYVAGSPKVARFFAESGHWDLDAIGAAATRATQREMNRVALAQALVAQQHRRGAGRAAESAARLGKRETVAIVTGQQPVLFGGPLFVLYKAIATVEIAARLESARQAPVVPVFWIAADDHDFAEIRSVTLPDETGTAHTLRYAPQREPAGAPAAAIVLDESTPALLDELARILPAGDFREETLAAVRETYRPGVTLVDSFARLLAAIAPELVILDAADPAIKRLMAPVLERELRLGSPSSRSVAAVGQELLRAGYHQQVPVREGLLNLFLLDGGVRRPLGTNDGGIEIRGTDRHLSLEEATRRLASAPESWSPGALLRPLAQDIILPTAAYIGGPAEVAYHAQIGGCYEDFGIPRPVLVPRPGVTLLDSARVRVLEAERLDLPDLQGDADGVIARWIRQAHPEVEASFERMRRVLAQEMGELARALAAQDATLGGAAHAATGRMLHPLETLEEKSMRALKKRDQGRAERLRRAHDVLFPGGSFQERGSGFLGFLPRYGHALIATLRQSVDPWAKGHQVVTL